MGPQPAAWPPPRVLVPRALVFFSVLALLGAGLVLRQGLHRHELAGVSLHVLPRWKMFSGVGQGLTQVRYVRVSEEGPAEVVDPYAVLGVERRAQPRGVWRVRGVDEARRLGRRLCRALGSGTTLRMVARTARDSGWRREKVWREDLCAAEPR